MLLEKEMLKFNFSLAKFIGYLFVLKTCCSFVFKLQIFELGVIYATPSTPEGNAGDK